MVFLVTYLLFGVSLISWQLWNQSKLSNILGKVTWLLLIMTVSNIALQFIQGGMNWTMLSYSLISLGISSFFAMILQSRAKVKWGYLLGTSLLHFMLISSPQTEKVVYVDSNIPEYIVKVKPSEQDNFRAFVSSQPKLKLAGKFSPRDHEATDIDDYFALDILGSSPKNMMQVLENHPSVDYVEENEEVFTPAFVSIQKQGTGGDFMYSDPLNVEQWALINTNMKAFYEFSKEQEVARKVKLFILDTGVDGAHEDIREVFVSSNKKNDSDKKGHGTHCAGIAAAVTGNDVGISSFNFSKQIEVHSEKVLADFGGGTQEGIIRGIISAVDRGADVISMSLGGRSNDKRQKAYDSAIKYATDKNCIVVVAAGNSSAKAVNYSPANSKGVITVAATDSDNNLASFSNTLEGISMGVYAPGVDILSTFPGNRYETFSGTSMATPFVAGIVSIMKSINPDLTHEQAFELLSLTVNSAGSVPVVDPKLALEKLLKKK